MLHLARRVAFGVTCVVVLIAPWPSVAQDPRDASGVTEYDFAITQQFLKTLQNGKTILPTFGYTLGEHSGVHPVSQDCELHVAAEPDAAPGDPQPLVAEPPNVCSALPPGSSATTTAARNKQWLKLFDSFKGKHCKITGFPRIFTEHATGGTESGGSNPNHVFEIHPALNIACDGLTPVSFAPFLTAPEGLRHITPGAADTCLGERTLEVRFADTQYEFRQHGGGCGNFAIVELAALNPKWIRTVTGGHTAIARVTADGTTRRSLKIYTFEGTQVDGFIASLIGQTTIPEPHILVHGVFTYDYFAMLKVVHPKGGDWQFPEGWTPIPFPLALVVYGETQTVPWNDSE